MQTTQPVIDNARTEERGRLRLIEIICFAVLLPVAVTARLTGWRWRPWPPGGSGYSTPLSEARAMASIVAGTVMSI